MMTKVLFIGFKLYNSILNGGGLENKRMLTALQKKFGAENVDTYYLLDEKVKRSAWSKLAALLYMFRDYHNGLTPAKVEAIVEKAKSGYNYVFISTSVLGILAKILKGVGYTGKTIVHFHNIEGIYYDAITPKWLPGRQIVVNCAANNDRYACEYADKIITLSQRDADYLLKHYGRRTDVVIGIGLKDRCRESEPKNVMTGKVPDCLFLGSYFPPNNEGVLWFVNNVLPRVKIHFRIVGKGMQELKKNNTCLENVEVLSDVPDLAPYFESADFMILPIFSGSGMKVKTCESLMFGKNILGSTETFEGYDLDTNLVGRRCDTAEEYIDAINYFAEHPVSRYNEISRKVFLEKYSEEATEGRLYSIFE